MYNVQPNQPNISHVFQLVNQASGATLEFTKVDQVCLWRNWKRNMEQCQRHLQESVGPHPLDWQHLGTGTPEEMALLMETLKSSYPGLG